MEVKAKRSAWRAWPRGGGIAVWYWLFVGWWLVPFWWMILGIAWLCGWRSKAGAKNAQMAEQALSPAPGGPKPRFSPARFRDLCDQHYEHYGSSRARGAEKGSVPVVQAPNRGVGIRLRVLRSAVVGALMRLSGPAGQIKRESPIEPQSRSG